MELHETTPPEEIDSLLSRVLYQACPYILSMFTLPVFVANMLEKLQQDFLWYGGGKEDTSGGLEEGDIAVEGGQSGH